MASRLYMLLLLMAASVTVLTASSQGEEPELEELTVEQLQREKEQLLKQLGGQQECQDKMNGLEGKNRVLRGKVDKDTPALEKVTKDAAEKLIAVQADTTRWRLYLRLVVIALVLTWGNSAFCLVKEGIDKLKPKPTSNDKPSKLMKKKNK